ncbi:MAG: DUF6036 family nucleotidyltransferase [Planctomycetota bacterium]
MRSLVDAPKIREFMRALGSCLRAQTRVYLVGGVSAVLEGWRPSTVDLDLKIVPDEEVFGELSRLKEQLNVNIELAAPDQFIPPLPGWEARSTFVTREGQVDFYHFDFYSQALAKIERGFERDLGDVREMVRRSLIEPVRALELFEAVESQLIRYPAIDPPSFRRAVEDVFAGGC